MSPFIYVSIFLLFGSGSCQNEPQVQQVNVVNYIFNLFNSDNQNFFKIFRHGDRTPQTVPNKFPNDPNMFRDFAPIGPASLTEVRKINNFTSLRFQINVTSCPQRGKQRAFELGSFLRSRYEKEPFEEFYAVHNEERRTADTLKYVLGGLQGKYNLSGQIVGLQFKNSQLYANDKCVE